MVESRREEKKFLTKIKEVANNAITESYYKKRKIAPRKEVNWVKKKEKRIQ